MNITLVAIAIKLNTQQPVLRDDIWWEALGIFIGVRS